MGYCRALRAPSFAFCSPGLSSRPPWHAVDVDWTSDLSGSSFNVPTQPSPVECVNRHTRSWWEDADASFLGDEQQKFVSSTATAHTAPSLPSTTTATTTSMAKPTCCIKSPLRHALPPLPAYLPQDPTRRAHPTRPHPSSTHPFCCEMGIGSHR
ncbi:hypothetical protein Hypma_005624 [Hypsizygus marmoreus]|uniref:Uncharacterized protein n=1 Tax=Hypsizygus marmoreus TaxID=39966 RepID=A0A369K1K2_HYPMA|nr:hypothetical protein Hypma_005624 [Hypsizygus marmoreus]